ncbi:MAG: hypothetical protein Q4F88_06925 [Eubacteriales bacterium]|nr:hypothetical protein [Eubacteriales bacterium]MDO5564943.1 hypothetical protein [Eubacteriales bacterium]
MKYEELLNNGTYIGENDFYNNGIYAGTRKYYLYNNMLFMRYEPTNNFSYDGEISTDLIVDNVSLRIKECDRDNYWGAFIFGDQELCDKFFEVIEKSSL